MASAVPVRRMPLAARHAPGEPRLPSSWGWPSLDRLSRFFASASNGAPAGERLRRSPVSAAAGPRRDCRPEASRVAGRLARRAVDVGRCELVLGRRRLGRAPERAAATPSGRYASSGTDASSLRRRRGEMMQGRSCRPRRCWRPRGGTEPPSFLRNDSDADFVGARRLARHLQELAGAAERLEALDRLPSEHATELVVTGEGRPVARGPSGRERLRRAPPG